MKIKNYKVYHTNGTHHLIFSRLLYSESGSIETQQISLFFGHVHKTLVLKIDGVEIPISCHQAIQLLKEWEL